MISGLLTSSCQERMAEVCAGCVRLKMAGVSTTGKRSLNTGRELTTSLGGLRESLRISRTTVHGRDDDRL